MIQWRERYRAGGSETWEDRPGSGRPVEVDEAKIVVRPLESPPPRLWVTHWSSRLLAAELGVPNVTMASSSRSYQRRTTTDLRG